MKSGEKSNWNRRSFIKVVGLGIVASNFLKSCTEPLLKYIIKLSGTNNILGHRLRFNDFPKPSKTVNIPYLIIGGGISGLSVARALKKRNIDDYLILELESKIGGNSASSSNSLTEFPLAAHYLPVPNLEDKELIEFLEECDLLNKEGNTYIPNPDHLCYAPQERLFINNHWQEDLVPNFGLSSMYQDQLDKFSDLISYYKKGKDQKGNFWFTIPIKNCSKNPEILKLEEITFKEWLDAKDLNDQDLLAYINYCCRDDFGLGLNYVSAWAGIHYFASRKYEMTNGEEKVFTWPEGNGKLVKYLSKYAEGKVRNNHLVYKVKSVDNKVEVLVYNDLEKKSMTYIADKVFMCTPQYVNKYIFKERAKYTNNFRYAPWITAAITVNKFPLGEGVGLSWDNVIHKGNGLGYIFNQNQSISQYKAPFVITYYHSLESKDSNKDRKFLYKTDKEYWADFIISDLKKAHYQIENEIQNIEIHKLGHGMISPIPRFIFSEEIKQAKQNINNTIFFAHSDLSGISIFEEAFHQGIEAVKSCLDYE